MDESTTTGVIAPERSPIVLDTSALLALITNNTSRAAILTQLEQHSVWCASELALAEGLAAIDRLVTAPVERADLEDALRITLDWHHLVPVDAWCLGEASRLCRQGPARISDAIHVAAGLRLPPPVTFLTIDPAQVGLAERAGLFPARLASSP